MSTRTSGVDAGTAARTGRATGGDRLPPPPSGRRPALAALAVLLIVGGAAVAGLLAVRADSRTPVLVAAEDIPAGEQITAERLRTLPVAAEGTLLVPAEQEALVVGQYARRPITAGQLLDTTMLTTLSTLSEGRVAVGASLAVGRVPALGLQPGDVVQLVRVVDGQGEVLVPDALVSSALSAGDSGASSVVATFIVDEADGAAVAGVGAEGQLAAVLVTRGVPSEEG